MLSKSGNANRRALLRFNLPSIPAGCSLTGATLTLVNTAAVAGRTIGVYRAGSAWTETGVTWNTASAPAGTPTTITSAADARIWDVGAHVQTMYSGTNDGFVIRDQTEDSPASPEQKYQARERVPDTQDPELKVSWG